MIEQNQPYTFEINNAQRDFKPRAEEVFLLQIEIDEAEWHHLGCFPTDAIGAIALRFDDASDVRLGFETFRRLHRTPTIGELFLIEMRLISQADWLRFTPDHRFKIGQATILWNSRREPKPKKRKEPTPYGLFWKAVRLSSIPDFVELHDWLGLKSDLAQPPKPEDVWKAMRGKFNTESLSLVSPATAIQAFEQANLPGVAAIARRLSSN